MLVQAKLFAQEVRQLSLLLMQAEGTTLPVASDVQTAHMWASAVTDARTVTERCLQPAGHRQQLCNEA